MKAEGPKNPEAEARMKPPKDTTVLQIGHWQHQKVNTVPQIDIQMCNSMV